MAPLSSTEKPRRWRVLVCLAVCAASLAALVLPAAAAADDPSFRASAPLEFAFPVDQPMSRLEMTTGSEAERFSVSISSDESQFPVVGGALTAIGEVTLDGPGTSAVTGRAVSSAPMPCPPFTALRALRGAGSNLLIVTVELPPNSTSALVVRTRVGDPPWPGMEAKVRYWITNPPGGTLSGGQEIDSPASRNVGRSGVQIALSTDPPGRLALPKGSGGCYSAPVAPGTEVVVRGTTDPPVAGQRIGLVYVPPGRSRPVPLAAVRADSAGSFAHRGWRPTQPGRYQIGAFYRSQSPELVDDFATPTTVRIARAPKPRLSLGSARTLRVTRRGLVRVRLRCLSAAATCSGALRLVGRAETSWVGSLGNAHFSIPAGGSRLVAVRLGRRGRALLNRRGALRVRAEARDGRATAAVGVRLKPTPRRR